MREKIIEIIGFGMERERAECKADELIELFRSSIPLNMYIYKKARSLNYDAFCKWFNCIIKDRINNNPDQ